MGEGVETNSTPRVTLKNKSNFNSEMTFSFSNTSCFTFTGFGVRLEKN